MTVPDIEYQKALDHIAEAKAEIKQLQAIVDGHWPGTCDWYTGIIARGMCRDSYLGRVQTENVLLRSEIERLQAVIEFCFTYDGNEVIGCNDTDIIGHDLSPMPEHIRKTILATLTAASAAKET